ncbi:MAG: DMT family transporter [Pseudomonadota bacterium]
MTKGSPLADNLRAALIMTGAMAAFTANDACMKALSAELPFFQALFLRSIGTVVLLGAITARTSGFRIGASRRDRRLIGLRSLAEVGAAYFFLSALFNMPIANVTAILQVLPLSVTLAAALFLKEPVGWRRIGAIALGGIGVILIIRPGPEGFNPYAFYALIAVACVTFRDLASRQLSPDIPSLPVSFATACAVLVFSGLGSTTVDWVPPSTSSVVLLAAATLLVIVAYQLSVMAMRVGDIAFVSPFRYSAILFALAIGIGLFGERPDAVTLAGVFTVVAAGLYSFWRERQRALAMA